MSADGGEGELWQGSRKGQGSRNAEKRAEERTRTISFSNFPKGTKADVIKDFIKEKLEDHHAVDVYTYDQRTTKGMVRFETVDTMWEYLVSGDGKQKLDFQSRRIYTDTPKEGEDAKRERAVWKVVRLLINHGAAMAMQSKRTWTLATGKATCGKRTHSWPSGIRRNR